MPKITAKNIIQGQKSKPQKRKKIFSHEPGAKRTKHDEESEDGKQYGSRFRYILAPKNHVQYDSSTDEEEITVQQPPKFKKKSKKSQMKADVNGNSKKKTKENSRNLNGKQSKKVNGSNNKKEKIMVNYDDDESDDDDYDESDDSYMSEDLESFSDDDLDESCEEEWTTDTDYSPHSFHESECEMVDDESDASEDYQSSDDEDYAPPIEDKYIKKGDAIMYDGKGLDLAFGDSMESQIIDMNDVSAAVESDDEVPELLPINESNEGSQNTLKSESSGVISAAEDTFKNLSLNDDETVDSSQLLQRASFYNCLDNRGVVVKINRTIHFHGILVIKPLFNSIQVNGFTLHTNQSMKATSISRSDYFLNLTPIIHENCIIDKNELRDELEKLLQTKSDADEILKDFNDEKDVLLHLQQGLPDKKVEMLQTYLSDPILPHKNMILQNSVCPSSELILATKFFVDTENLKLNVFKVNADWENIDLKQNTRLMIIGGK